MARATKKYTATALTADGLIVRESSTRAGALRLAATLPGRVRVATPAGNLVKYVHNQKERPPCEQTTCWKK